MKTLRTRSCSKGLIKDAKTSPQSAWQAPRHRSCSGDANLREANSKRTQAASKNGLWFIIKEDVENYLKVESDSKL